MEIIESSCTQNHTNQQQSQNRQSSQPHKTTHAAGLQRVTKANYENVIHTQHRIRHVHGQPPRAHHLRRHAPRPQRLQRWEMLLVAHLRVPDEADGVGGGGEGEEGAGEGGGHFAGGVGVGDGDFG